MTDEEIQILKSNRLQLAAQDRIIDRLQANQREIAAAFDCQPDGDADLVEAAKLLKREAAAAPELLGLLREYVHESRALGWGCSSLDERAVVAIHKAEGRPA